MLKTSLLFMFLVSAVTLTAFEASPTNVQDCGTQMAALQPSVLEPYEMSSGCRPPKKGPAGPRGKRGATGATGGTGAAGSTNVYASFYTHASVNNKTDPEPSATIDAGDNVIFNQTTVSNPDEPPFLTTGITYNSVTGEITLAQTGDYLVIWGVSLKGTGGKMAIVQNGNIVVSTNMDSGAGNQTTTNTTILHVTSPNTIISVTNVTTQGNTTVELRAGNDIVSDTAYLVVQKLHDLPTP